MLNNTSTWELIDPPFGANIIESKQVFKAKKDAVGNIVCYKACVTVVLWTSSHILYGLPLHQKDNVSKATC